MRLAHQKQEKYFSFLHNSIFIREIVFIRNKGQEMVAKGHAFSTGSST